MEKMHFWEIYNNRIHASNTILKKLDVLVTLTDLICLRRVKCFMHFARAKKKHTHTLYVVVCVWQLQLNDKGNNRVPISSIILLLKCLLWICVVINLNDFKAVTNNQYGFFSSSKSAHYDNLSINMNEYYWDGKEWKRIGFFCYKQWRMPY